VSRAFVLRRAPEFVRVRGPMTKIRGAPEGEHDSRTVPAAAISLRPSFRNQQLSLASRQFHGVADLAMRQIDPVNFIGEFSDQSNAHLAVFDSNRNARFSSRTIYFRQR